MLAIGAAYPLPDQDASQADQGENRAEGDSSQNFPADHTKPIAQAHLAKRDGPDNQGAGLGAGIAAAADNQGQKERENDGFRDLVLEVAHSRGGEHFAYK